MTDTTWTAGHTPHPAAMAEAIGSASSVKTASTADAVPRCAPVLGLRARKRAATQDTIEREALSLVEAHGYDQVTVEMICEAAVVSQRTFFNYFGSKEGVILGAEPPMPSPDAIETFVSQPGTNVLSDLVELFTAALIGHEPDPELLRTRRSIIHRTPALATKEFTRMGATEGRLLAIMLDRFAAQGRTPQNTPDLEDEARMVITLATGVMRATMRKWFNSDFTATPSELLTTSIAMIRRITQTDPA